MSQSSIHTQKIWKYNSDQSTTQEDLLAVEEPLEIKLLYGQGLSKSISVTMRTPGQDFALAAGFLYTEGIIQQASDIEQISHPKSWNPERENNVVEVKLKPEVQVDLKSLERHFYTTSSCGVCGKTSIEAVQLSSISTLPEGKPLFSTDMVYSLPAQLQAAQPVFAQTGGLHAAALFDQQGKMHYLQEDVGRHNAVDKLIGTALQANLLPLHNFLILVSGRCSFELVQKSVAAGIPLLVAIGAPSSLAISLAQELGMSVIGFARDQKFNLYCGEDRITQKKSLI